MARGIDHVVHSVHDLDAAAALYRALGFQVGARNRHPPSWGTQNHIVQLGDCFLELLALADQTHVAPHAPRYFSFGAFHRDALARGQGLSMLALESRDAHADALAFRETGIGDFATFDFERKARRPDGTAIKVAFSLAFASNPNAAEIGFFTCQHRFPKNFWNPAFQVHSNTAATFPGIVMVAAQPSDLGKFLSAFAESSKVIDTPAGIVVKTPRGDIQVTTPAAFENAFGVPSPDDANSARLAALRIGMRDLAAAATVLNGSGFPVGEFEGKLIVGPRSAMGATLIFEPLRAA
jgi:hypothetical protein